MLTNESIYGNKSAELIQESVAYKIIWTIIHLNIFKNVHQQLWYSNEVYSHVNIQVNTTSFFNNRLPSIHKNKWKN